MPENEIDYYFYELSSYPMSLFRYGAMGTSAKVTLKNFLFKRYFPLVPLPGTFTAIADGGVFLRCCKWTKNETFRIIFYKYECRCCSTFRNRYCYV